MSDLGFKARTAYNRAYYRDTAERRRTLARHRRQAKRWTVWLLAHLEWPIDPTPIVPRTMPIRRPTLRLARMLRTK